MPPHIANCTHPKVLIFFKEKAFIIHSDKIKWLPLDSHGCMSFWNASVKSQGIMC